MSQRNATDREELQRADDILKRQVDDMRFVMSDPKGRRFLWQLLGECGLYRLSYEHSGSATMFKEGERNVALKLQVRMIEASEENFLLAQQEAYQLARQDDERVKRNKE